MHCATSKRDAQALPARAPGSGRVVPAALHGARSTCDIVGSYTRSCLPLVLARAVHALHVPVLCSWTWTTLRLRHRMMSLRMVDASFNQVPSQSLLRTSVSSSRLQGTPCYREIGFGLTTRQNGACPLARCFDRVNPSPLWTHQWIYDRTKFDACVPVFDIRMPVINIHVGI